jgi:hypothetical protein
VVITRRGLLAVGAGTGAALVGCGAPEDPPADAELLGAALALEQALVAAYRRVPGRLGRELTTQAQRRAARLEQAGAASREGPSTGEGDEPLAAALALQRRAMAAYVAATGDLRTPARRVLAAELLTAGAQHAAVLTRRLGGDPLAAAFPDGRAG